MWCHNVTQCIRQIDPYVIRQVTLWELTGSLTVMRRGKTPLKVPPWARKDGLGLGVVVCSRVVLSKCIGQVTLSGPTGSGSCDA